MTNHTTQDDPFNQYQRIAAENYAGGDFAWILDHPDWRTKFEDCGDTFFTFLMLEFSDLEYPTDKPDALHRLQRVADDVEELYDIIDALQQPANRIIATFVPQVWINDHAVTVDPPGETSIDITAAVLAMTRAEALDLRDDTDQTDALIDRDTAPAWIRDWKRPFYLAVEGPLFQILALGGGVFRAAGLHPDRRGDQEALRWALISAMGPSVGVSTSVSYPINGAAHDDTARPLDICDWRNRVVLGPCYGRPVGGAHLRQAFP